MEDKNIQNSTIKDLLKDVKLSASENLQYRVMQQIQTEKVLSKKKSKSARPVFGTLISIAIVMYAIIGAIGLTFYLNGGVEALNNIAFYIPVLVIAVICSTYGLISILDDKRSS